MKKNKIYISKDGSKISKYMSEHIEKCILNENSFLALDTLEKYADEFKKSLEDSNYNVHIINLREPEKSNIKYNPMSLAYEFYLNNEKDKAHGALMVLANEIFTEEKDGDPYWVNMCKELFVALGLILFASNKNKTLVNLYKLIANNEQINKLKETIDSLDVLDPIYIHGSAVMFSANETRLSIISVFKQYMNALVVRDSVNNLFDTNKNNINYNEKTAIFIVNMDEENYEKGPNLFARTIINQIAYNAFNKKIEFSFYLPNYETISYKGFLENYFITANERNIEFVIGAKNVAKFPTIVLHSFERISIDNGNDTISANSNIKEMMDKIDARIAHLKEMELKNNNFNYYSANEMENEKDLDYAAFKIVSIEEEIECLTELKIGERVIKRIFNEKEHPILKDVVNTLRTIDFDKVEENYADNSGSREKSFEYGPSIAQLNKIYFPNNKKLMMLCEDFLYEYLLKTDAIKEAVKKVVDKDKNISSRINMLLSEEKSEFEIKNYNYIV